MVMLGALSTIGVLPIDRKGFQMSISELLLFNGSSII
jgi:hypothetical protein